jgi:cytochrome c-type biogenesis protein CcmH/NrfG
LRLASRRPWGSTKQANSARRKAIYREVLERKPDHPQALHLSGVVSLQMGRPDDAVGFMEHALAVNPNNALI